MRFGASAGEREVADRAGRWTGVGERLERERDGGERAGLGRLGERKNGLGRVRGCELGLRGRGNKPG